MTLLRVTGRATDSLPVRSVPWREHREFMAENWIPRETPHISVISPTRNGKTVLLARGIYPMIPDTDRVFLFDAKGYDAHLNALPMQRVSRIPSRMVRRLRNDPEHFRVLVHDADQVSRVIATATREGDTTLIFDETRYIVDPDSPTRHGLGLGGQLDDLWVRHGGAGVCVVAVTQGPRFMPASFYEQASHVYIGNFLDKRARRRLSEIGGDTDLIDATVTRLPRFCYLYVGPLGENGRREMHVTKVDA